LFINTSPEKQKLIPRLRGVSVAVVTPFRPSGEVNEEGLRKNIQFLIDMGIKDGQGFLLILGTTGEFSNLSKEEACEVVQIGAEECKGKVPFIVGSNHSNIRDVIEFGQYGATAGADAILVRPTYYWGVPSDDMVLRHYDNITREVPTGIVIYNRCLSNVVDLPIPTLKKLAQMDRVVALKDGTPSFSKFDKTIKELTGRISCINGWGEVYEPYTLLMGSDGFLSVVANFIPHLSIELYSLTRNGNYVEAEKIHKLLVPLLDILFSGTYGQFIELTKFAMETFGLAGGPVRDPLPRATPEQKASLINCLKNLGAYDHKKAK
jgi:4-hydroxy-tetrahydrodipicolinate synthase